MPVHLALKEGAATSAALPVLGCRISVPAGLQNSFLLVSLLGAAESFTTNSNPMCPFLQRKQRHFVIHLVQCLLVLLFVVIKSVPHMPA